MPIYEFYLANYKLREYEKVLAKKELEGLIPKIRVKKSNNKFRSNLRSKVNEEYLQRLTFFSKILIKDGTRINRRIIPDQVRYEMYSGLLKRNNGFFLLNNFLLNGDVGSKPTRKIRYLTHLFHEYKGRFYPQLCKSFMNYAGLKHKEIVLDPFCGSGTTLVECFLNNLNGIGLDLNPLGYLITKSKIESFLVGYSLFKDERDKLHTEINKELLEYGLEEEDGLEENEYYESVYLRIQEKAHEFFDIEYEYLEKWFPKIILSKILIILLKIRNIQEERIRHLFLISLSETLRIFSYQDPKQLRIKRRMYVEDVNIVKALFRLIDRNLGILNTYDKSFKKRDVPDIRILLGDIRHLRKEASITNNSVDAIITSPPYAMALPYIDTDRLSLLLLGYINKKKLSELEKRMIGNREISKSTKEELEREFLDSYDKCILPIEIKRLIRKIYDLNFGASVGFRRKNTAALLYKYFYDMYLAMAEMYRVLRKRRYCFMVVGCNTTMAGGEGIFIPTDDFISSIGKSIGFLLEKKLPLSVQSPYMIHSKNAIKKESVLVFRKT